jgi:hypothetical protein
MDLQDMVILDLQALQALQEVAAAELVHQVGQSYHKKKLCIILDLL